MWTVSCYADHVINRGVRSKSELSLRVRQLYCVVLCCIVFYSDSQRLTAAQRCVSPCYSVLTVREPQVVHINSCLMYSISMNVLAQISRLHCCYRRTPHNRPRFSGPCFIRLLLGCHKQHSLTRSRQVTSRLCRLPNVLRTRSKQQCLA